MDILKREQAPFGPQAWKAIDEAARKCLKPLLSARRFVDVSGPKGWGFASVDLGCIGEPKSDKETGIEYGVRLVQPLVENRAHFELGIWELDDIERGRVDIDFEPLERAARDIAGFEERAVYRGLEAAGIKGLKQASAHRPIPLKGGSDALIEAVSEGVARMHDASIEGPYCLALDTSLWKDLWSDGRGYPPAKRLRDLIGGPIIMSSSVGDAVLASVRGGDFLLVLGQDLSIGFHSHNGEKVRLYFTESFTFRVIEPRAAVVLAAKS